MANIDEKFHDLEKRAMCLDRRAVLDLVDILRGYRCASKKLLAARYKDGECDALALSDFEEAISNRLSMHLDDDTNAHEY
jgi:hypothetical protein